MTKTELMAHLTLALDDAQELKRDLDNLYVTLAQLAVLVKETLNENA